jgi:predicted dehydrogenase/flavin reductase (DIM6/NTAB) family NADH-FMN oxidoreductase RutF
MLRSAVDIWDARIQSVTSFISAYSGEETEIFAISNFAAVSTDPPKIIVNPNPLYPIEEILRREKIFSLNVMSLHDVDLAQKITALRRRQTNKPETIGLLLDRHPKYRVPYWRGAREILICEVDEIIEGYDHTIMICLVRDALYHDKDRKNRALLFRDGIQPKGLFRFLSGMNLVSTTKTALKKILGHPTLQEPDLPFNTYINGGIPAEGIKVAKSYGLKDQGPVLSPPAAPKNISSRIGVCIIGTGIWGVEHCKLFKAASPHVDLFLCSRNEQQVCRLAQHFGASDCFTDMRIAMTDPRVDAVSIVLPHTLHKEAVNLALAAGKHVLLEKPIATTLKEADELVRATADARGVFMVAENMHFRPAITAAVALLKQGAFGEPLHLNVRGGGMMNLYGWKAQKSEMGGGILIDLGIHYIRLLRVLLGEPARVIASQGMQANLRMEGEDSIQLLFESNAGWRAHFLLTWSSHGGPGPDVELFGEKATARFWPFTPYFDIYGLKKPEIWNLLPLVKPLWLREAIEKAAMPGRTRVHLPQDAGNAYSWEIKEFLAAIQENRPAVSSFADARRDLEIVQAAYRSIESRSWQDIPSIGL